MGKVTKMGKDHCTSIFFGFGCVCDVENCDLLIENSFNNPPERKIENYLRGKLVFSLGKAATQMRGSKVMLTVRVRLQFNYLYLEDFCNFWLL
jgi:hypothetical protein